MKNLDLKFLALLITLFLLYYVNNESNSSVIGFLVPVEVRNLPPDRLIIWQPTRQAQVTFKGPSFLLSRLAASPPTFKINVPPDAQNRIVQKLNLADLDLPQSVQALSVDPAEVEIRFDTLTSKEVEVQVPQIGVLDRNYRLDDLRISPPRVQISGPDTEVHDILRVQAEPVDLRDLKQSANITTNIIQPGTLTKVTPEQISVEVLISKIEIARKFENLVVEVRSPSGKGWIVSPASVMVELRGPPEVVNAVTHSQINPYVKVNPDREEAHSADVQVDAPEHTAISKVEPKQVQLSPPVVAPPPIVVELPTATPTATATASRAARSRTAAAATAARPKK